MHSVALRNARTLNRPPQQLASLAATARNITCDDADAPSTAAIRMAIADYVEYRHDAVQASVFLCGASR